jgi:3-hydroxybutyryl-CoA dehydrogenase
MKVVLISENPVPAIFPTEFCVRVSNVTEAARQVDASLFVDLDFGGEKKRVTELGALRFSPVMVNAVNQTIAEIGQPFIRINGWPGMAERGVHELVIPDAAAAARLGPLYEQLGCRYLPAPDIPGMVTARILATIINEAWFTWEDGVSSKEEIDTAMRLGTNYPMGPFEWGAKIGLSNVVGLLEVLSRADVRYTPAASLKNAVSGIKI